MNPQVFRALVALLLFFSFTASVSAAALAGGFAPASLWLSRTELADGDAARASTVLYDSGDAPISGDLIFTDNGTTFGSVPFSLLAGESRIYSANWTARGGSHTLGAALANVKSGSGTASVKDASTASISIDVAQPAPPSAALSAATSTAGAAANAAFAAFDTAESVRTAGVQAIKTQLAALSATTTGDRTPAGKVLGVSTQKAAAGSAGNWLQTFERAALTGLLFVFDSQLWFYLLALVVFFLLYKIIRTAFSDRRHRYR